MHCTLLVFGISLCPRSSHLSVIGDQGLHLEAWGPANSCAQAALVKRRWTQFCQGTDTGKAISLWSSLLRGHEVSRLQHESTRPNTTRLLKTFGYVWHVAAHAIWSWCGSGFGVVVPSSEECTPSNLTELCKVNEAHMKCVELICSLKMHWENMGSVDEAAAWYKISIDFMVGLKWVIASFGSPTETLVQIPTNSSRQKKVPNLQVGVYFCRFPE